MNEENPLSHHERWARFRFSVVSPLLAAPPGRGRLAREIRRLAQKTFAHPITGDPTTFGFATIERWYYQAKKARDPIRDLRRKVRSDRGERSITAAQRRAIREQYGAHPGWSKKLHHDNLRALAEEEPGLLPLFSYSTLCRYMREEGLVRRRGGKGRDTDGFRRAVERLERREVRSFEASHPGALYHLDFHHGKIGIVTTSGDRARPIALGILDDRSRLGLHVQWYRAETAENLVHGLVQAYQKWGISPLLLTDNGKQMLAGEVKSGLSDLGVVHETTLPYSPYQNGKQEVFWTQLEGRLVAMLEGVADLTLRMLNEATTAWLELEYNRRPHREIGTTPLKRYQEGRLVSRESPSGEEMRRAFTRRVTRRQRRSDGTITIKGKRFEIPGRFRHEERLVVRYAEWDLATAYLFDPRSGIFLDRIHPLNRERNASGERRSIEPQAPSLPLPREEPGLPPLMRRLLSEFSATGLPYPYLPKDEEDDDEGLSALEVTR